MLVLDEFVWRMLLDDSSPQLGRALCNLIQSTELSNTIRKPQPEETPSVASGEQFGLCSLPFDIMKSIDIQKSCGMKKQTERVVDSEKFRCTT